MKKFYVYCVATVLLILAAGCTTNQAKSGTELLRQDPDIVSGTLDNGLNYYILHNEEPENRITVRLVVQAGSNMEEEDQRGVAHLVEHMAFNGSEHFAEQELVNYFESIGMAFGPEVNAYTSFDETVYMIELPADDPEFLATGMTILRDWACGLTFDNTELDKERGVITEEWRLGRGVNGRLQDVQIPFLFKNSRYADRLPIGSMDVIQNISRDRVVDFYTTWYRPDRMSVILVGDQDPAVLEQALITALNDIPVPDEPMENPAYTVPAPAEPDVLVFTDKEQPYTIIQLLEYTDFYPVTTKTEARQDIIRNIAGSILTNRLNEISQSDSSPWLDAAAMTQGLTNTTLFNVAAAIPRTEGSFTETFTALLDEIIRFSQYGILDSELDRAKQEILSQAAQLLQSADNIPSSSRAQELINYVLTGQTVLSIQDTYNLYTEIIPSITQEEINQAARQWMQSRGQLLMVAAPDTATGIPSEADLLEFWQNYTPAQALEPYTEDNTDRPLMERPENAGSIITSTDVSDTEIMQYTLSNGAKLLTLKTDFKKNEILFKAVSRGGASLVADEKVPSAFIAPDYVSMSGLNGFTPTEIQKKLAGIQVSAGTYIGETTESMTGSVVTQDLETLMQLIHLSFAAPDFTSTGWANLTATAGIIASSRETQPAAVFQDTIVDILYGSSIRKSAITPEFTALMNQSDAETIYQERFANAADFTFIFVGDFNETELLSLAETYIATLPADPEITETARWTEPSFPDGNPVAQVQKGQDAQSSVFIAFGGNLPEADISRNHTDAAMLEMLRSLLDIRLREVIREDKSGTYGVSVYTELNTVFGSPERNFCVQISFGCEPGREQELAQTVLEQIELLQQEPVADSYITKLTETYRRSAETALKTNSYWINCLEDFAINETPLSYATDIEPVLKLVSPDSMMQAARTYLDRNNFVTVYLTPEN